MPITPTYPGVYIEELPSGVRPVTGVATSITAFVGRTRRGPVNDPITCNNYGDFDRIFGGLWVESPVSYAIRDFFQNGGGQAVVVRLHDADPTEANRDAAAATATTAATAQADKSIKVISDNKAKTAAEIVALVQAAATAIDAKTKPADRAAADAIASATVAAAASAPSRKDLTDAADAAAAALAAGAGKTAAEALVVTLKAIPAEQTNADVVKAATDAVAAEADPAKKAGLEAVSAAVAARAEGSPSGQTILDTVTPAKATAIAEGVFAAAPRAKALLDLSGLKLEAAEPGAWGNGLRARITVDTPGSTTFNLFLLDGASGRTEEFLGVNTAPSGLDNPRRVDDVLKAQSTLVRAVLVPATPTASPVPPMPRDAFAASYSTGVLRADMASDGKRLTGTIFKGSEAAKTGIYALEKTDLFNILCIPPFAPGVDAEVDVLSEAVTYCERKRAFMVLDAPSTWITKDDAKKGINEKTFGTSRNAAIYFPRLKQRDPLRDNQVGIFPACGVVAGLYARTDTNRGVWKAPAGLEATLNGVPELAVNLTDPENGELNPMGLNCLRVKPGAGRVIWGARTLAGDDRLADDYKYIPVRRLALMIEESLYRGMQWVVFEPNDEPLWAQIRMNATSFMHGLFRQGAFAGASPKEAYLVKCDRETTPQADVNLGRVNILIGFAPLKPAEFVFIRLQQLAGQPQG